MFGFTLRVAHGVEVGLEMEPVPGKDSALLVKSVKPDGAVASWNRQCVSGKGAGKEIKEGDTIVAINQISDAAGMLTECREKSLLKFLVMRGEPDCPLPHGWGGHDVPSRDRGLGALTRQALAQACVPPPMFATDAFAAMAAMAVASPPPPPPPLAFGAMA